MQSSQTTEPGPVPYTLRIGVTGHRDLPDVPMVEVAVAKLLLQIKSSLEAGMKDVHQPAIHRVTRWQKFESYLSWKIRHALAFLKIMAGNTEPSRQTMLRWEVYSSLARGADRIVARAVMNMEGAGLVAVIPGMMEDYKKDFKTPADLQEFEELIVKASNYNALIKGVSPLPGIVGEKYEQAGKDMVDACEILIAVWDGKPARGIGGTAGIVKYAISIHRPVVWINPLTPGETPVVISGFKETNIRHQDNNDTGIQVHTEPLPVFAAGWSPRFMQVAEYNRDRAFRKSFYDRQLINHRNKLLQAGHAAGIPSGFLEPLFEKILPHYVRADYLASHYHKLHLHSAAWMYRLAAIAVTIAVVQTLYFPAYTGLVALEILSLAIAVIWFRNSVIQQWHDKWLNYRHLAERTRILIFQSIAGCKPDNGAAKSRLLPFYPDPGNWVADVMEFLTTDLFPVQVPEQLFAEVKSFVGLGWINEQVVYHALNASEKEKRAQREHKSIGVLLCITLAAAIVHLTGLLHSPFFENLIISLVIVLPAFAASQHAIGSIRDFERLAARSARMKDLLLSIEKRVNSAREWDELRTEILHAEEIMSTENLEWSVSFSYRRISLPV